MLTFPQANTPREARPARNDDNNPPPPDYNAGGDDGYGSTQVDGAGDGGGDWATEANEAAAGEDWAAATGGAEVPAEAESAW